MRPRIKVGLPSSRASENLVGLLLNWDEAQLNALPP